MSIQKIFKKNSQFTGSSTANKLVKSPTGNPNYALKIHLKFTVIPKQLREDYIELLDRMIKRTEKIINSNRVDTKTRLRALEVLAKLIQATYVLIRDVEIEQLEQEIARLEEEAARASQ